MNQVVSAVDPSQFRVPCIRHLAWMCQTPQLFRGPLQFGLGAHLPADALEKLRHWDHNPEQGPSLVNETPNPRLGLYFERLYECLMTDVLGWDVLARNLPIRSEGITLGELDFVLRNPHTQGIEHHEIAIKFYLGYPLQSGETSWYGPNAKDRLDIKTRRLLEHQSQRIQLAETVNALGLLGIHETLTPRIFMPGYLFYPFDRELAPPLQAPSDHAKGHWLYHSQVRSMNAEHWLHLRKPHWLGPWVQPDLPDIAETKATLEKVERSATPRLFARLEHDGENWKEVDRIFVVPATWPLEK